MNKQQDFYEILRSKLVDRDIPAEEQDWRDMRQMIDDSRKRKRRLLWGSLVATLLLLCLSGYLYLNKDTVSKKDNALAVNQEMPGIQNKVVSSNSLAKPDIAVNKTPENATANRQTINSMTVNTVSAHSANTATNKVKVSIANPNTNYIPKRQKAASANNVSEKSEASETIVVAGTSKTTGVKIQENKVVQPNAAKQTTSNEVIVNTSSSLAKANSPENNRVEAGQKQNEVSNSGNSSTQKQEQSKSQLTPVVAKKDSISALMVSSNNASNVTEAKKADSDQIKVDNPSVSPVAISQTQSLPPLVEKPENSQGFSIEAGAAYGIGWKDAGIKQGSGIDPYIGVGYQKMFGFKWSVKTGVGVDAIDNIGTIPFVLKHNTYDFGLNTNDTTLTTKWLIYATLPLQVEYKVNDKNAIGLGGTLSYLLNGWGSVDVTSAKGDNNTTSNKTYKQFMYVEGYNRWNASVFLLYRRTLFGRLSVYVMPYFGLADIKSNSFFGQNAFERNSGIKLLLSYHIF